MLPSLKGVGGGPGRNFFFFTDLLCLFILLLGSKHQNGQMAVLAGFSGHFLTPPRRRDEASKVENYPR